MAATTGMVAAAGLYWEWQGLFVAIVMALGAVVETVLGFGCALVSCACCLMLDEASDAQPQSDARDYPRSIHCQGLNCHIAAYQSKARACYWTSPVWVYE